MDIQETDRQIRQLFADNLPPSHRSHYLAALNLGRRASAAASPRPRNRRWRTALASAGALVLVAAAAAGIFAAAHYGRDDRAVVVITDDTAVWSATTTTSQSTSDTVLGGLAAAEPVKTKMLTALRALKGWKAEVAQTDVSSDGTSQESLTEWLVTRSGNMRTKATTGDSQGETLTAEQIRRGTDLYSRRVQQTSAGALETVLHTTHGYGPDASAIAVCPLGEVAGEVLISKSLSLIGPGTFDGKAITKYSIDSGMIVSIDDESGLPVREELPDPTYGTIHDVQFKSVMVDPPTTDADFDPATLAPAQSSVTEYAGFRESTPAGAAPVLGFTPQPVGLPAGFAVQIQGYQDPKVPIPQSAWTPQFTARYFDGERLLLVTWERRPGIGDEVPAAAAEGGRALTVGGHSAALQNEEGLAPYLEYARDDVLITLQGEMSVMELVTIAEQPSVADGTHFGFVHEVSGGMLVFDPAEWLTGEAAAAAYAAHGQQASEPFYIDNPMVESIQLLVDPEAVFSMLALDAAGAPTLKQDLTYDQFARVSTGADEQLYSAGFNTREYGLPMILDISAGRVTGGTEQYVP